MPKAISAERWAAARALMRLEPPTQIRVAAAMGIHISTLAKHLGEQGFEVLDWRRQDIVADVIRPFSPCGRRCHDAADDGSLEAPCTPHPTSLSLRSAQVSSAVLKKPFALTGPASGWVSETASRPQTTSPTLAELSFQTMELYAMPAATQMLLDDSVVNLDEWIAAEVEQAFATQEGVAFVTGDGVNKPKGFLAYTTVDEASWTWGNLGYVATGVSGALPASNPSDKLVDLVYALKAGYRQNGAWMMNRKTQGAVRKLKDADGNYLWQPPAQAGAQVALMGFPLHECEDMPDPAANSLSIAFGDFARGYLIVDRVGVRVLRDPFSSKPYVLFYVTKRVGGGVQNFDAIKLLKYGVS